MSVFKSIALLAMRRRPRSRRDLGALALEAAVLAYPPLRGPRVASVIALRGLLWAYPRVRSNPALDRQATRALASVRERLRATGVRGAALDDLLARYASRIEGLAR